MPGRLHEPIRLITRAALAGGLLLALLPAAATATDDGPGRLSRCGEIGEASDGDGVVASPWRVVLDADGAVTEHRLTLRRSGVDTTLHTGRRGFAVLAGDDRLLVGERDDESTRLSMIDTGRVCRLWTRRLDRLVYPERDDAGSGLLRFTTHDPVTRLYEGTLLVDVESGTSRGLIDDECIDGCTPNDGDVSLAALASPGSPRPVPNFAAGGWAKGKTLPFRWKSGAVPPAWAKGPLKSAANDVKRTAHARSPQFVFRSDASNAVSYAGAMPSFCGSNGIACAGRRLPSYWGVWLRPHGTDYAWGTLRWCQKRSANGCFDIRRVMLHELGHIVGLNHPSSAGFTLAAGESVMQGITPNKPKPGSTRHSFGRCDVATLQELYDVPDNRTAISTCNDVATKLALTAAKSSVARGRSVKFSAELRIDSRSGYRQLANNPLNARSVKLKYRRAGSDDGWKTAWMKALNKSGRYELTIAPQKTWEFKATFPVPADEGLRFSRSAIVKVKVQA